MRSSEHVVAVDIRRIGEHEGSTVEPLYREAGWLKDGREDLTRLIAGSFLVVAAFDGQTPVGMGRVISDGASDAYIQDVFVSQGARGRGIGTAIVTFLRDACLANGIEWIGLVAKPNTAGFYERLGFKGLAGHVPMLLNRVDH